MRRCQSTIFCVFLISSLFAPVLADEDDAKIGHISGDIFGKKDKWYHAYLSLSEAYDDNIFNTENNEESDLITVVCPGIQFTIPGTEQKAEDMITGTATPGGLVFGRYAERFSHRFSAYLGYAPKFHFYKDNTDEDIVYHNAQAGMKYNLKGGLSFDMVNQYVRYYDQREADTSTQTNEYSSNLFNLITTYTLSEKVQFKVDYTNFRLDYKDEALNGFKDRSDNAGSGFFFFRFRPKTAVFIKYRYIDINYKNDDARDSVEQIYSIGIVRKITGKTTASLSVGCGIRQYEDSVVNDSNRFIFEAGVDYYFSPKTSINFNAYRRNEESSEKAYNYTITTASSFNYAQKLTHNLNLEIDFTYSHNDYEGGVAELLGEPKRKDNYFQVTPSLTYNFRRWLSASLAYTYRKRDSGLDLNSYTGNTIILKITGSI